MLKKEIPNSIIPFLEEAKSPETKIPSISLRKKILKLNRWIKPISEEVEEERKAINDKFNPGSNFKLNRIGGFLSGDKDKFNEYAKELDNLFSEKIKDCDIKFKEEEFDECTISLNALMSLDNAGLLEE